MQLRESDTLIARGQQSARVGPRRRPVEIGSGGLCDFLPTSQMRDGLQGSTVVKAAGVGLR